MPFDDELADRIRVLLDDAFDVDERRMFGGLAFLVSGNFAIAASHDGGLLVRGDPADGERVLAEDGVEPFETRGRALAGWARVAPGVVDTRDELEAWVDRALAFARTLPPKGL